jgi:hypothetical protein
MNAKYDHRPHAFGTVDHVPSWDIQNCAGTVPPALVTFDRRQQQVTVEVYETDVNVDDGVLRHPVATTEHLLRQDDYAEARPTDAMIGFYAGAAIRAYEAPAEL